MPINTQMTGAAIAAYRQRMNLSQQGLAGLMNVTHQAVSKWEKGLALPDTETLLALSKLFGTSMEDLLMGKLPATPESEPAKEEVSVPERADEEAASSDAEPVRASDFGDLDFNAVMNMLPFASARVADQLFLTYAASSKLDASKLGSIAPFVSSGALADYVSTHPFQTASPEVVAGLAPFLPTKAVDEMIRGLDEPLPPHVVQMLMPFASTTVVDQMVMGKLGIPTENASSGRPDFSRQIQDKVHEKIRKKLETLDEKKASAKRESPRMRLIRKAIESGSYEMLENFFHELEPEAYRLLLNELSKTGDAALLELFCENVCELGDSEQADLVHFLINGRLYYELDVVIDELDEDVQHELLDKAFEINDPELMHIISKHL